jgi:hypothetical protein
MAEWQNGEMVEYGGMAEWRNGRMAEWHNVQYEIVRDQDMESTQMPPWQSPSCLVTYKKLHIQNASLIQKRQFKNLRKNNAS